LLFGYYLKCHVIKLVRLTVLNFSIFRSENTKVFSANIRLGWECFTEPNTSAYYHSIKFHVKGELRPYSADKSRSFYRFGGKNALAFRSFSDEAKKA
jgi:hypothetical protein